MSISHDAISAQVKYRPVINNEDFPFDFPRELYFNPETDEDFQHKETWDEELRRMKKGFTAEDGKWVNPFYYFFLNYCKADILNIETEESEIGNPYYLEFQNEFADLLWFCQYTVVNINNAKSEKQRNKIIKDAVNIMVAKGRRKGLTTLICGFLIYLFIFGKNVKLGYGYPDEKTYITFRAIFDEMINGLPPMLKPNMITPDNKEEIGNSYIDENGDTITTNRIYWGNFATSTGAFRGKKLFFVFFDEAGKYEKWSRVKGATKDCFKIGKRKIGYYVLGGTSDAITNKGYKDYKDDVDKPHLSDGIRFLIYAYEGMHPYVDYNTGKSIREPALREIKKERKKLKEEGKIDDLRFAVQENPVEYSEFFVTPGGNVYDNDEINDQISWIVNSGKEKEIVTGRLEFEEDGYGRTTGKVIFIEDKKGYWQIYKKCMPNGTPPKGLHLASFDDVYKSVAPNSDSMPSMMIYKDYDLNEEESDLPVAVYINSNKDRKNRFKDFLMGSIFFNASTLGEINDEAMVNYYRNKGYIELLKKGTNGSYGYSGHAWDGKFKSQSEELMLSYIENKRLRRCYFIDALNGLKDWGMKNTDIGICYHGVLLHQNMNRTIAAEESVKKHEPAVAMTLSAMKKPAAVPRALRKYSRR